MVSTHHDCIDARRDGGYLNQPLVQFVLGGVQKAGTTALARYLGAHPRIRLPRSKEAHVFDAPEFDEAWTPAQIDQRYAPCFDAAAGGALHGDATPIYLMHPRFIERIARYNSAMRWIVLLRDPAERALSHYHMERARSDEPWPFWPAMLLERWRLRGHADDFGDGSPLRHHSYRLRGDYRSEAEARLITHFRRVPLKQLRSGDVMLLEAAPESYSKPAYLPSWIALNLAGQEVDWTHVADRIAASWELAAPRRLLEAGGR